MGFSKSCLSIAGLILLASSVINCGGVKKAQVAKDPITSPFPLQDFVMEGQHRSRSNTFFLWRVDQAGKRVPGQTSLVAGLADDVNKLDVEIKAIEEEVAILLTNPECDSPSCKDYFNDVDDGVAEEFKGYAEKIQKAREAVQIIKDDSTRVYAASKMQTIDLTTRELESQFEVLANELRASPFYTKSNESFRKIIDIQIRKQPISIKFELLVLKLTQIIDYYQSPPTAITLKLSDQGIPEIKFEKWSLDFRQTNNENATTFSTENKTIENVTYERRGGRWKFDLIAKDLNQRISLVMSRSKYKQGAAQKTAYYSGDFTVKDLTSGQELRTGVVKISAKL